MSVILGINHQFLYPEAMVDPQAHLKTLREIAAFECVDALDCWVWPEKQQAREEISILQGSGKWINYNIGDRPMDEPCFPASPDAARRARSLVTLRREVEFALECGAKKIILGSGPDVPSERNAAKERFGEILLALSREIPGDIALALEPTDRDLDKFFLLGPAAETAEFIRDTRRKGARQLGMLLDMGHIPIMGDTLASAVKGAGETLEHIHLGNCIVKDRSHPFYGDKHIPWSYPGSEYGPAEAAEFISLLKSAGYFEKENCTLSFEMRVYEGTTPVESLSRFMEIWRNATA